jgi:hypothetical protein
MICKPSYIIIAKSNKLDKKDKKEKGNGGAPPVLQYSLAINRTASFVLVPLGKLRRRSIQRTTDVVKHIHKLKRKEAKEYGLEANCK